MPTARLTLDDSEGERIAECIVSSLCASAPQFTTSLAQRADTTPARARTVIIRLVSRGLVKPADPDATAWVLGPIARNRLARAARRFCRGAGVGE